ncbi:MAG TPA: MFS transporter [Xanthobacteraceae bacterium]|jgi:MFS family permease|nr:MFS transporter [Xanthobacteraceae bacterium]
MSSTLNVAAKSYAPDQASYRWLVLVAATIAQASACFLVQGFGAIGGYMQNALGLSAFQIGLLMSAAQFVPIIGLLVAGELLDRFSERLVVGIGALIVAGALACASFSTTYEMLLLWLIVVGAGYSTAQPGGSKSVAAWFSKSQRGFAMGIRQAGLPLGGALAAASLPFVAASYGWHQAFLVGAAVAFVGGALFIAVYRSPVEVTAKPAQNATSLKASLAARFSMLRVPAMRKIMWSGITLISVQYGVLIFVPLDFRDRFGLPLESVARLLFLAQIAGVVGRIALAAWSDRCKSGRYFPVATSLGALIAGFGVLLLVPNATPTALLAILAIWLGFFGFGWYGPWVAYVSESAPPDRVGFALGLAMAINQIAIIGSPPLLGFSRDMFGNHAISWIVLIACLFVALIMTRAKAGEQESAPA